MNVLVQRVARLAVSTVTVGGEVSVISELFVIAAPDNLGFWKDICR